jgi:Papain family cysteine protease/Domain of unknown function (DUF4384)
MIGRRLRAISLGVAFATWGSPLCAQPANDGNAAAIDPADAEYFNGVDDLDPAIERTLPVTPRYRAYVPVSVDLSHRIPRPENQGHANSCMAWATAYAARSYYTAALENRDVHAPGNLPSPNYVYNLARQIQGKKPCEGGSNIIASVEVLKRGALSLADYPYRDLDCDPAPTQQIVETAKDFRVRGFRLLNANRIDDLKGELAQSNPVIIEFRDSPEFHRLRGAGTFGDASFDPSKNSWHAMTLIGYDDQRQAFRLINSWGPGWGDHGYAWVGYEVIKARVRRASVLDVAAPTQRVGEAKPDVLPPSQRASAPSSAPFGSPVAAPSAASAAQIPRRLKAGLADLQGLSCAKIEMHRQGDRNVLSGFVGSDSDLGLVEGVAADVPSVSLGEVVMAPWPQCEALQTLEKPLAETGKPRIEIGAKRTFQDGDLLRVEIKSPPRISYLYIAYIQADGSVVHLAQPEGLVPHPTLPDQTMIFGDGRDGRAKFTIGRPFGREMIIAIAASSPLFEQELPPQQTERDYLTMLRRALIYKPAGNLADREVSAAIMTLETQARQP